MAKGETIQRKATEGATRNPGMGGGDPVSSNRKADPMKHLALIVTALLAALPLRVSGQATITVEGYGYGEVATIQHGCSVDEQGRITGLVGTEVTCPVWATDREGTFAPSSLAASASDTTKARVWVDGPPMVDGVQNGPHTLHIEILSGGSWTLTLEANPMLHLLGYMYTRPAPTQEWPEYEYPVINTVSGEKFVLCAYTGGYGMNATSKSIARPVPCPDLGDRPLPEFEVRWEFDESILEAVVNGPDPDFLRAAVARGDIHPKLRQVRRAVAVERYVT